MKILVLFSHRFSLSINCRGLCFLWSLHINIPEIFLVFTVSWVWGWKNLWQFFINYSYLLHACPFKLIVTNLTWYCHMLSCLFVCFYLFISTISTLIYRSRSASPPYTRRSQSRSPPPRRRSRSPPPPRRDRSRSPRRDRSPYDRDRRGRRWCMRLRHVYRHWVFHDIKQLCSFKLPHVGFCFKIILLA